jgi:hypothetical protein
MFGSGVVIRQCSCLDTARVPLLPPSLPSLPPQLLPLLLLLQQPVAMAKEFDLVSSWNSYITNSSILRVRHSCRYTAMTFAHLGIRQAFCTSY